MRGALALAAGLAAAVGASAGAAHAEPTAIEVRVLARGSKFVGTSMGGAHVVVRDKHTGAVLAAGVTAGGTGDTGRVMTEPHPTWAPIATGDAAAFTATIDLDAPRLVEVTARGPLAQPQAAVEAAATMWLVPGADVTGGDGWVLELPGLAVDVLAPAAHAVLGPAPREVRLEANVTMLCGCPIEPGGLWPAEAFEVRARIERDGAAVAEVPLGYAGEPSRFAASWTAARAGVYGATVYAHQPANGNTGLDGATFVVTD